MDHKTVLLFSIGIVLCFIKKVLLIIDSHYRSRYLDPGIVNQFFIKSVQYRNVEYFKYSIRFLKFLTVLE